ncbi:Diguanylate cyclase/phosphodiesterase with PAS/PAC and GAF sensor [Burkholderia sp. SJ98]|nr:Diguanylate cyclase/phosphodiesterase with PAS/PAC and GAF sensor [Burkholderia sp. SJ98]
MRPVRVAECHGQREIEYRALSQPPFGPRAPVMTLDDAPHVGEPDARALELFRAMQALEHPEQLRAVLHVEADAVVAHADHVFVAASGREYLDFRRFPRPRIFHRVRYQVAHRKLKESGVAGHARQIADHPFDASSRAFHLDFLHDRLHEQAEIDRRGPERGAAHLRERQQVVDERARETRRFQHVVEKPPALVRHALAFLLAQKIAVSGDMAQRRAQIMRYRIRERLQLLVRAREFGREFRALFRAAQHDVQQRAAQFGGDFELALTPQRRMAAHRFEPRRKARARRARAIRAFDLDRLARPFDRLHQFGTEPQQIVAEDLRDRHREHAARLVCVRLGGRPFARERIRRPHAGGVFREPVRERAHGVLVGRRAEQRDLIVEDDRRARGTRETQYVARHGAQAGDEVLVLAHRRNQAAHRAAQRAQIFALGALFLRFDLQGQHVPEMLDRDARIERHDARAVIVTRDESPQLSPHDDRHGHRRMRAHVAHVLQMHGREAAQRRKREIGGAAGDGIHARHEARGRVVDIGDEADTVLQIQRARLTRNVRRREELMQERRITRVAVLREHVAAAFLVEAIEHHAAEARDRPHFAHGELRERLHAAALLQPARERADERIHRRERIARRGGGLHLDDERAVMTMYRQIEAQRLIGRRRREIDRADVKRRVVERGRGGRLPDALRARRAEHDIERSAEQFVDTRVRQRDEVLADLQDVQIVGQHEQKSMRLDAAGNVDRLGIAVLAGDARAERAPARFGIGRSLRCFAHGPRPDGRLARGLAHEPAPGAGCEYSMPIASGHSHACRLSNVAMAAFTASS